MGFNFVKMQLRNEFEVKVYEKRFFWA